MKVGITGVSGYLGKLILKKLLSDKNVTKIVGFDIHPLVESNIKFKFIASDIRDKDLAEKFKGLDAIYHLAGVVDPSKKQPLRQADSINIAGSKNVISAAINAGVNTIIYASSIAVYGSHSDNPPVITELTKRQPNQDWYYSRAKGAVEEFLDDVDKKHPDTVIVRLRPSIIIGRTADHTISRVLKKSILWSTGAQRTSYTWEDDVADAFHLALYAKSSGAYNISAQDMLSVKDIGRITKKKVINIPKKLSNLFVAFACKLGFINQGTAEWINIGLADSICVSSEKAEKELGWKPKHSSKDAILKFVSKR